MIQQSVLIEKLMKIFRKAGASIVRDLGELSNLSIESKGRYDFVSSADKRSEKIIAYELQQLRPEYHFLMEESGYIQTTDWKKVCQDGFLRRWVIDPIDGTMNFIRGNPDFVICISLEHIDFPKEITDEETIANYASDHNVAAKVIAAIIYLPVLKEFYWAEEGVGAYHVDQYEKQTRLNVSNRSELPGAVVNTLMSRGRNPVFDRIFDFLNGKMARWRISGSIAKDLCYLSAAKNDIVIFDEKLKRWDLSAAYLIARESGAKVVDLDFKIINNIAKINNGMIAGHPSLINKLGLALSS